MEDRIIDLAFLLLPLVPWVAIYAMVRHGPFPNRWWRGEHPLGFAFLVGTACFSLGFFGPMILTPRSNLGPLVGILYTGPLGMALGVVWGSARAWRRGKRSPRSE